MSEPRPTGFDRSVAARLDRLEALVLVMAHQVNPDVLDDSSRILLSSLLATKGVRDHAVTQRIMEMAGITITQVPREETKENTHDHEHP
jgi:hypothetical protein